MKDYKFLKRSLSFPDVPDYRFTKRFPSAYLADRWASRTLMNHNLTWWVVFLPGEEDLREL